MNMLLIHPPVTRPCEPPAGIARLCGALHHHGIKYSALDANLEGLLSILETPLLSSDTWTKRASHHSPGHLALLNSWDGYKNAARYRRAIKDLNRILERAVRPKHARLGLANYEHEILSPVRSADLIRSAENPEDNPFYPYFKKRLTDLLKDNQPPVIGFSLNYLSQGLSTFAMLGFLRREWPKIKLSLGGGLVTSWMRRPHWENPFGGVADYLVAGPGEGTLLSLFDVRGKDLVFRPDFDCLPTRNYFAPGLILPYSASTGCYWNRCSFCPEGAEGNSYVPIPADEVIRDLLYLVDQQKPVLIHLLDNAINPSVMKAICEHPLGVPWYGFARISRHLTDPDFCRALKQSGCVMLQIGLESGDQSVLDDLQKRINLDDASIALKNLKESGIATYVYLLFGTPSEDLVKARRTLEFVVQHHDCIHFLNLAIFNMPTYGPDTEKFETSAFYEGDLSLYTSFDHPEGWSRQRIRQFLDKEFRRHPAIAPILRRDPPIFTSNHAPFFVVDERTADRLIAVKPRGIREEPDD